MTHLRITTLIAPINRRGLQRPMYKALAVLDNLRREGRITNLTEQGRYVRSFDVPPEHLRRVERELQRVSVSYRKFPVVG